MQNFKIENNGIISKAFLDLQIFDFEAACLYIKNLKYKRNLSKNNKLCVLVDGYGTCSSKHALLYNLAQENNSEDYTLQLCMFKLNEKNTQECKSTLEKFNLEYIPEAHNYLRFKDKIIDCTKSSFDPSSYESDILEEFSIQSDQITDFKVNYQKEFLSTWLENNTNIKYNLEEIWEIREECIRDLFG